MMQVSPANMQYASALQCSNVCTYIVIDNNNPSLDKFPKSSRRDSVSCPLLGPHKAKLQLAHS